MADKSLLSVNDISNMTNIPTKRIEDIIDYKSSATPCEAFIICETLGVDLEKLLGCY